MQENLVDKILTPPQKLWLETVYTKQKTGRDINDRIIKVELLGKLPPNFNPSEISSMLLRGSTNITLLGICLIKPEDEIIRPSNAIIKSIQKILKEFPDTPKIIARQISELTDIRISGVEEIFKKLSETGLFHSSGITGSNGLSEIYIDEKAFDNYLKNETIDEWINELATLMHYNSKGLNNIFIPTITEPTQMAEAKIIQNMKAQVDPRKVFIVHGRNLEIHAAMCNFLRSIDLDPMEWSEARKLTGKPNPYVGEILDAGFSNCQAVLVLFTPDDEAKLLGYFIKDDDEKHERELTPQPRQNVIFEAGMAMAKFPDRTVLVQVGKIRPMSDISGLHILRLNNSTSSRQDLAERLADAKCNVKIIGKSDWHTMGDFELKLSIATQKDSPSSSHGIAERTNSRDAKNSEKFESMRLYTNKLKDNEHNSIFSEVTKNTFPSSITRIKGAGEEALFLISFTEFVFEKDIIAYVKKLEKKGLEIKEYELTTSTKNRRNFW